MLPPEDSIFAEDPVLPHIANLENRRIKINSRRQELEDRWRRRKLREAKMAEVRTSELRSVLRNLDARERRTGKARQKYIRDIDQRFSRLAGLESNVDSTANAIKRTKTSLIERADATLPEYLQMVEKIHKDVLSSIDKDIGREQQATSLTEASLRRGMELKKQIVAKTTKLERIRAAKVSALEAAKVVRPPSVAVPEKKVVTLDDQEVPKQLLLTTDQEQKENKAPEIPKASTDAEIFKLSSVTGEPPKTIKSSHVMNEVILAPSEDDVDIPEERRDLGAEQEMRDLLTDDPPAEERVITVKHESKERFVDGSGTFHTENIPHLGELRVALDELRREANEPGSPTTISLSISTADQSEASLSDLTPLSEKAGARNRFAEDHDPHVLSKVELAAEPETRADPGKLARSPEGHSAIGANDVKPAENVEDVEEDNDKLAERGDKPGDAETAASDSTQQVVGLEEPGMSPGATGEGVPEAVEPQDSPISAPQTEDAELDGQVGEEDHVEARDVSSEREIPPEEPVVEKLESAIPADTRRDEAVPISDNNEPVPVHVVVDETLAEDLREPAKTESVTADEPAPDVGAAIEPEVEVRNEADPSSFKTTFSSEVTQSEENISFSSRDSYTPAENQIEPVKAGEDGTRDQEVDDILGDAEALLDSLALVDEPAEEKPRDEVAAGQDDIPETDFNLEESMDVLGMLDEIERDEEEQEAAQIKSPPQSEDDARMPINIDEDSPRAVPAGTPIVLDEEEPQSIPALEKLAAAEEVEDAKQGSGSQPSQAEKQYSEVESAGPSGGPEPSEDENKDIYGDAGFSIPSLMTSMTEDMQPRKKVSKRGRRSRKHRGQARPYSMGGRMEDIIFGSGNTSMSEDEAEANMSSHSTGQDAPKQNWNSSGMVDAGIAEEEDGEDEFDFD